MIVRPSACKPVLLYARPHGGEDHALAFHECTLPRRPEAIARPVADASNQRRAGAPNVAELVADPARFGRFRRALAGFPTGEAVSLEGPQISQLLHTTPSA